MGGLRPRDPVDIAGPRPPAGVVVRPLNFTVRAHMKRIAAVVLLASSTPAWPQAADSWIRPLPDVPPPVDRREIPRSQYVEIPVSMLPSAEERLKTLPIVQLAAYDAGNFRVSLQCRKPSELYLVRAVFGNGATGGYALMQFGVDLWVSHQYLGPAVAPRNSALLVCLDFQPHEVYVTLGGGM